MATQRPPRSYAGAALAGGAAAPARSTTPAASHLLLLVLMRQRARYTVRRAREHDARRWPAWARGVAARARVGCARRGGHVAPGAASRPPRGAEPCGPDPHRMASGLDRARARPPAAPHLAVERVLAAGQQPRVLRLAARLRAVRADRFGRDRRARSLQPALRLRLRVAAGGHVPARAGARAAAGGRGRCRTRVRVRAGAVRVQL